MPATFGRSFLLSIAVLAIGTPLQSETLGKLDPLLRGPVQRLEGRSRVIVRASDPAGMDSLVLLIEQTGGISGRQLPLIGAVVADVPNTSLALLSDSPLVRRIALDRPAYGMLNRTAATVGVDVARQELGFDGASIGVAVIDSGVAAWHDDLATADGTAQRVEAFVDFVSGQTTPSDEYGHGTHVAGIIAGNGFDSAGARAGIAPGVRLVVLKVLDAAGRGRISDVIAAIGFAVEHKDTFGLRVINLSVGAGVFESAMFDMLTVAAKKAVDRGIVVVASAGNAGKNANGGARYGGITAPGNAPWVLTVGASSHMGTVDRADDTVAAFSSRGPTAIDRFSKPDVLAPGVGIESLSDPASALFANKPSMRINGVLPTAQAPYLSLSGTSQAAPVVTGIVALMLQANPSLSPNAVKAILQYTAQSSFFYDVLTQGAGFVDARGAVALARFLAAPDVVAYPTDTSRWSRHVIWGNHRVHPGPLVAAATVWRLDVTWGAYLTPAGQPIVLTATCLDVQCKPSTTSVPTLSTGLLGAIAPPVVVSLPPDNVVWGTLCAGANCSGADWTAERAAVWGTADGGDTVVWGSSDGGDTVVWGSSDSGDTVVWGSSDSGDTVVWGSSDGEEDVVWDRSAEEPEPRPVI